MNKIYIKTHLKKLPPNCAECDFSEYSSTGRTINGDFSGYRQPIMLDNKRPEWCPLVEVKQND